jgi:glycerol uptake facilitator-like aquaporin
MRPLFLLIAQFAGGLLGVLLVIGTIPDAGVWKEKYGGPRLAYGADLLNAFFAEALGCFFLTFVALCNYANRNRVSRKIAAPIAMGLAHASLVVRSVASFE